jgi:signal transduction histidine kinase
MLKPENPLGHSVSSEPKRAKSAFYIGGAAVTPNVQAKRVKVPPVFSSTELLTREVDCRPCREALATAAHDLKTPIAILSGYIELILSEKLGPLSTRQRTALEEMHDNGQRLAGFVNNFLAIGALRDSPVEVQLETADLNVCLAEIVQVWLPTFQRKQVGLFFAPGANLPPFPFDYHKVQHVVSNLLDNALKFSPTGGAVSITAELHLWERRTRQDSDGHTVDRRCTFPSLPNTVRVTVVDSGPGVAPEFHQEIFQEYFRANHATEGHGLGLAIAQRLVTRFGGKIWVESEPGLGAKFAFLLPLKHRG